MVRWVHEETLRPVSRDRAVQAFPSSVERVTIISGVLLTRRLELRHASKAKLDGR